MGGCVPESAAMAGAHGKTVVLSMDQRHIAEGVDGLMGAMRGGERAIPVAWKVRATSGGRGFDVQAPLLDAVAAMMPEGIAILLAGDRGYGTAALLHWCQAHGWQYRLRVRDKLIRHHEGGDTTTGAAAKATLTALLDAALHETGVHTPRGILHENGHKEPWMIARSDPPSKGRVLEYGRRWGLAPLFSDVKSRGFGIPQTQRKHASRIERRRLILTMALDWAASTGMPPRTATYTQQKRQAA